jgi:N-acetylmuramoyl-L-alanine amidase
MRKIISIIAVMITLVSGSLQASAKSSNLIYLGSCNNEVSHIQQILLNKGYFNHEITGYYGNITKNAVISFQRDSGIATDGIVGPITRSKLYTDDYNSEDLYWLSRIVHAESEGERHEGKLAVANTILNRVKSSEFPNTVYGVIFDKKHGVQYTPVANGKIYNSPEKDSISAAKSALEGNNNIGKAMFFYNPRKSTSNWIKNNRKFYATIGNHNFHL